MWSVMGSAAISFHCLKIGHLDNDKEWVGILVSRYQDTNGVCHVELSTGPLDINNASRRPLLLESAQGRTCWW